MTSRSRGGPENYVIDDAGRTTVLTPALAERLVAECRKGRWPQQVAITCDVDPRTLKKWIERGTDDLSYEPYQSFATAFLQAEAEYAAELEDVLMDSALGRTEFTPGRPRPNVEVARYLLERRMRSLWGGGGVSALEVAAQNDDSKQEARRKAAEFLSTLPEAVRQTARDRGIMIDGSTPELSEAKPEEPKKQRRIRKKTRAKTK